MGAAVFSEEGFAELWLRELHLTTRAVGLLEGGGPCGEAGSVFSLCFRILQIMSGSQKSDEVRIPRAASVALFPFALL